MSGKKKGPTSPVGYGRPPVHSRFRRGQSGNPSGKRRNGDMERARKLICREAYRLLPLRVGDQVIRLPALQAVIRSLITGAAKGSVAAQRVVAKLVQDIEAEERARRSGAVENKKLGKDVNDMTDEELMAIVEVAQEGGGT